MSNVQTSRQARRRRRGRFVRRDVATLIGIAEPTVTYHIRAGNIDAPTHGGGKQKYYTLSELIAIGTWWYGDSSYVSKRLVDTGLIG